MLPQSRNTIVRSLEVVGRRAHQAVEVEEAVLVGQRELVGRRCTSPSPCRAARGCACIATSEPSASPSGFSCVSEEEALGLAQIPEHEVAVAARAVGAHASPSGRARRAARRCACRGPSSRRRGTRASGCASCAARAAMRRWRKPCAERSPSRVGSRSAVVAEHAHVHARMAQVWAGVHTGHGHKSDARVLEVLGDRRASTSRTASSTRRIRSDVIASPPSRSFDGRQRCARPARPPGSDASSQRSTLSAIRSSERRSSRPAWPPRASRAARGPGDRSRRRPAPKRVCSCALTDASSLRLPFRLPASGKCRWISRTEDEGRRAHFELALDLPGLVDLEHVALLDVGEVREHDAALEARPRPRGRRR